MNLRRSVKLSSILASLEQETLISSVFSNVEMVSDDASRTFPSFDVRLKEIR
jgi:hypothetical protein